MLLQGQNEAEGEAITVIRNGSNEGSQKVDAVMTALLRFYKIYLNTDSNVQADI